jgi:hypothetical protein
MSLTEEALGEEAPRLAGVKLSAQKVRSLLLKAGLRKAAFTGWVYANSGFKIGKLHVAKGEDKVMVEYMPQHVYGVISREDSLRQAENRQKLLLRYREVLQEAGLEVTTVNYSEGGNVSYLLVGLAR